MARVKGECYFCGSPATTRDHVPPKVFFAEKFRRQLLTLPACALHNTAASKDDEYTAYAIINQGENPDSTERYKDHVAPTLEQRPALTNTIYANRRLVRVRDHHGEYTTIAFAVDLERTGRVFDRVARGLYFRHTRKRYPAPLDSFNLSLVHEDGARNEAWVEADRLVQAFPMRNPEATHFQGHVGHPDAFRYQISLTANAQAYFRLVFYAHYVVHLFTP